MSLAPTGPGRATVEGVAGVSEALETAVVWGDILTPPGAGETRLLWEHLATMAAHDLGAARAIEPHLDAVAILDQAGTLPSFATSTTTWGVFAAEGGPPLRAIPDGEGWLVDGRKPWCSLADRLDAALVTAQVEDGVRQLFAVELQSGGVRVHDEEWVARGLSEIPSGSVEFERVAAVPVGGPGWYLARPGFEWGGIGVAACWYGGAVGIARDLFAALRTRSDDISRVQLGTVDEALYSARAALAEAAGLVDTGDAIGASGRVLAKRVRALVAGSCETVLRAAGHALGPAPLARDAAHAKRVADLQLYIRQHHAERDLASLGTALLDSDSAPW